MADGGGVGDELARATLPSWVYALKPLVGVASGLATIGSDPEKWVQEVVAEWFVGGALDALQYGIGWIIYSFDLWRTAILDAAGPVASPYLIMESVLVGTIETIYGAVRGVVEIAGLAGPPAAAVSIALLSAFLAAVAYALVYIALNWIPGSGTIEGLEENLDK